MCDALGPAHVGEHIVGDDRRLLSRGGGSLGVGCIHHIAERPDVCEGLVAQRGLIDIDPACGIGKRADPTNRALFAAARHGSCRKISQ
jgi:hypothetical protein